MNAKAALSAFALLGSLVAAQEPAAHLNFEVASVRRNTDGPAAPMSLGGTPGRLRAVNIPLEMLIAQAYGVRSDQIVGVPPWATMERFDILATVPDGAPQEQQSVMLQSLLQDRFKLATHREVREGRVYDLVVAEVGRLGPRLRPTAVDCVRIRAERAAATREARPESADANVDRPPRDCDFVMSSRLMPGGSQATTLRMGGATMASVAEILSPDVGRPVTDRTGLDGDYDVELEFARQRGLTTAAPGSNPTLFSEIPTLFTALEEQLGLRLRPGSGPVEFLVIDHVERPTPN